jgi:hypothetical protein
LKTLPMTVKTCRPMRVMKRQMLPAKPESAVGYAKGR